MRLFSSDVKLVTLFAIGGWVLAACSSDSDTEVEQATIDRACGVVCEKIDECGFLIGTTVAQCTADCREPEDEDDDGDTCSVSDSEANACIDAVEQASCTAFTSGPLPACDFCPDDPDDGGISEPPDAGTNPATDAGTEPVTDAGAPSFDAGPGVGCTELQACCSQLPTEGQEGCNTTVSSGDDAACAAALAVFQAAMLCT